METNAVEIAGHKPVKRKVGFYLSTSMIARFDSFCERNRVVRSEYVEAAVEAAMRRDARRKPTNPAA